VAVIVVEHLSKSYGEKKAVDDLSFTVAPGKVTGFLGPNGSGKSTTMRCMLGLDRPDSGNATFDGRIYGDFERPLAEVGSLLDAGDAHKGRTARNHLRWIAMTNGFPTSRVDEVLQMVGMSEVAKTKVGKFSLGMRQRLGLATALLGDPKVVILDEPANGLDPEGIRWTRDVMRHLADQGKSVLVSSHQLVELSLVADDLIVIGQGKLISSGPVSQFMTQHAKTWVHVASPQLDVLVEVATQRGATVERHRQGADFYAITAQELGELAAQLGVVLHELSPQTGSLEQAFLDATDTAVEYRGERTSNVWQAPQP
jgi:ABC-2 type transport system ATP-binding protein